MYEQEWLKPATTVGNDQQSRLAAMLRQGPMQGQQHQSKSPITQEMADKMVDWMKGFGKEGLPNTSQNSMTNAVTPDFQSGNYGAPTMNMTGANSIQPNFQTQQNRGNGRGAYLDPAGENTSGQVMGGGVEYGAGLRNLFGGMF